MHREPKLQAVARPNELVAVEPLPLTGYRYSGAAEYEAQSAVLHYWQILRKHLWYVLGALMFGLAISVVVTLATTKIYQADAKIAIFPEGQNALWFKDVENEPSASDNDLALQTQALILLSDTLALKVVENLHLDRDPRFVDVASASTSQSKTSISARSDSTKVEMLRRFRGGLKVEMVPGTRVVQVSYADPNPQLATEIVNNLVDTFIEANVRTRYESATQTSEWLSKELADLRLRGEEAEQKLVHYQQEHGILGIDEKQNVVTAKLDELNRELTAAQADRIQKESNYKFAASSDPNLPDRSLVGEGSSLLQSLRAKEAELDTQYAQLTTEFGPGYQKVAELSNQLKQVRGDIAAEQIAIQHRLRNDYLAAVQREKMLSTAFEQQKQQANQLNESAIEYSALKRDAESNRLLYENLLQKLKEAGIVAGLRSSNIRVVDAAQIPDMPIKPSLPRNLAFGFLLSLGGGIALALVMESLDTTVRNVDEVRNLSTLPALAVIPMQSFGNGTQHRGWNALPSLEGRSKSLSLIAHDYPNSPAAESFRALRTSIVLSNFGSATRVILVTSALPQEGKTTVSANSALVMAQRGGRVLLVDADLRGPGIQKIFGINSKGGLGTVISGSDSFEDVVVSIPQFPNLSILPAGAASPKAADLLGSDRLRQLIAQWRNEFDHIIIDTPPCLSFTDAVVLSRETDGVILVARWGRTGRAVLRRACDVLTQVNANLMGIVLNACDGNVTPISDAFRSEYFRPSK
jgi:capsular exopolysaccharide synthesis family protein